MLILSFFLKSSFTLKWWAERDSNPRSRRQGIYSPPHLTALESAQLIKKIERKTFQTFYKKWSHWSDLNRWPFAYKASALPAELQWLKHKKSICETHIIKKLKYVKSFFQKNIIFCVNIEFEPKKYLKKNIYFLKL